MVFDDVQDLEIDGLAARFWSGAAPMLRLTGVRGAAIRAVTPKSAVDTLLQIEGKTTERITLTNSDLSKVDRPTTISPEVPDGAFCLPDRPATGEP